MQADAGIESDSASEDAQTPADAGTDSAADAHPATDAHVDSAAEDSAVADDSAVEDSAVVDAADAAAEAQVPDAGSPDSDTPDASDLPDVADDTATADTGSDSEPEADAQADAQHDAQIDAPPEAAAEDSAVEAGPQEVDVPLVAEADAISSYLMSAFPAEWNLFWGATVPLGRHWDGDHVSYHTALRFASVPVPAGAQVLEARLTFYPTNEVDSSHPLWINIYAERSANSAPFDPSNYDAGRPDQRPKTSAHFDHWLVRCNATCSDSSEYDCPQRRLDCWDRNVPYTVPKDLKTLVQEVIDQPGWTAGRAMTILLINAATDQDGLAYRDHRSITGYDVDRGPEYAPRLRVVYQMP